MRRACWGLPRGCWGGGRSALSAWGSRVWGRLQQSTHSVHLAPAAQGGPGSTADAAPAAHRGWRLAQPCAYSAAAAFRARCGQPRQPHEGRQGGQERPGVQQCQAAAAQARRRSGLGMTGPRQPRLWAPAPLDKRGPPCLRHPLSGWGRLGRSASRCPLANVPFPPLSRAVPCERAVVVGVMWRHSAGHAWRAPLV